MDWPYGLLGNTLFNWGLKSQNQCLFSLQNAFWKFNSTRGLAHSSRLNFWEPAVDPWTTGWLSALQENIPPIFRREVRRHRTKLEAATQGGGGLPFPQQSDKSIAEICGDDESMEELRWQVTKSCLVKFPSSVLHTVTTRGRREGTAVRIRTSEPGRFHDGSQHSRSWTGLAPTAVCIRTSEPPRRFEPFHRLGDRAKLDWLFLESRQR